MKIYKSYTLFLMLIIAPFFVNNIFSQTNYTLQQCVNFALKNHRNIATANNNVQIAYARKREGQSAYLPQINAQAKWDDNLILQSSVIPSLNLGAVSTPEQIVKFGNQYNTVIGIELYQTVFNYAHIQGIKAIKPGYEISKLNKQRTEEEVMYNTIAAYYQILLLTENEKLVQQSEQRLNKTLPIVQLQYSKGVIKKIDVDRVQVNYNNLLANLQILKTNKELAYNNLKYSMAMNLDENILIDTNYTKEILDADTYTDTANIKNKTELKLLNTNLYLQQILAKRTKAAYYPVVSFYGRYGAQAFGEKFSKSFSKWYDFASLGVKLDIPIFDGLRTSSAVRQANLNIENIKQNIAQTEDGLKLQMQNAKTQLQNSNTNLAMNKETILLAKNIYDVTTLQYQKGVIGYLDLLSAEYAYKEAENNYLQSLVKYLTAKLEADKSNNNINSYK